MELADTHVQVAVEGLGFFPVDEDSRRQTARLRSISIEQQQELTRQKKSQKKKKNGGQNHG